MMTERALEADVLKLAASNLEAEGYSVFIEPSAAVLPAELKGLHPDGIAIGKKPNLVIEVAREGVQSLARVQELQSAIKGNQDWKLQLFLVGGKSDEFGALPLAYIGDTVRQILEVAKEDARPALLMCWAHFEALARSLEPSAFARAQSPGRIVELLASRGYVGAKDAEFLRAMADKRNKYAHGQLAISVDRLEVVKFVGLIEAVIKATSNRAAE